MVKYDFHFSNEKLTQSKTMTYHHASLAHNSYVDFIFLPRNLINTVKSYDVIDDVFNISDHVPVVMQMYINNDLLSVHSASTGSGKAINNESPRLTQPRLIWDRAHLSVHYDFCFQNIQPLLIDVENQLKISICNPRASAWSTVQPVNVAA